MGPLNQGGGVLRVTRGLWGGTWGKEWIIVTVDYTNNKESTSRLRKFENVLLSINDSQSSILKRKRTLIKVHRTFYVWIDKLEDDKFYAAGD